MSSIIGNKIKISVFGESHGKSIGVVIDGLPSGKKINLDDIILQLLRRSPGLDDISSMRQEKDIPEIQSGLFNNKTTGTPLCAIIKNEDILSQNYEKNKHLMRPGHADYTGHIHYKGFEDYRGGGHFSGRLTCPIVFAGSICRQILEQYEILIASHISSIGNIQDENFNPTHIANSLINKLSQEKFPVINKLIKDEMKEKILEVKNDNNSIGGTIECAITGVPAGIGEPIFDGIESKIASFIFGIPGVKGLEFGSGFQSSLMMGSENNDEFIFENNTIKTSTNNHGGILGGISSGMPILFKIAIKPTPSIPKPQNTINIKNNKQESLLIHGRHDPCIVPRVAPVVESISAIAILDLLLNN